MSVEVLGLHRSDGRILSEDEANVILNVKLDIPGMESPVTQMAAVSQYRLVYQETGSITDNQ